MDFELILLILFLLSGGFWLADYFYFYKKRVAGADRPVWLEYTAGFFPVIFIVFVIRSFLFEPFNIPSGSMIPTLRIGDLILVSKFEYGLRLPVLNSKVVNVNSPQRGDVAVFRWPKDDSLDYIKRVVGLPGDVVEYKEKSIIFNGKSMERVRTAEYLDPTTYKVSNQFEEKLGDHEFKVLNDIQAAEIYLVDRIKPKNSCKRVLGGISCTVPKNHYFVLGDNRDNSSDSRYWGFVPESNLVGKAFLIWFNFGDVISGRFNRLGLLE